MHDGEQLSAEFLGEPRPGCSLMVSGDTALGRLDLIQSCFLPSIVVYEATFWPISKTRRRNIFTQLQQMSVTPCKCMQIRRACLDPLFESNRTSFPIGCCQKALFGSVCATLDGDWFEIMQQKCFIMSGSMAVGIR